MSDFSSEASWYCTKHQVKYWPGDGQVCMQCEAEEETAEEVSYETDASDESGGSEL